MPTQAELRAEAERRGLIKPIGEQVFALNEPKTWDDYTQTKPVGPVTSLLDSAANALLLGFGDKLVARNNQAATGATSEAAKDAARRRRQRIRDEQPAAALAGDITGFVAPGVGILKAGSAAARTAGRGLVSPSTRAALIPQGTSTAARLGRYGQSTILPSAIAGAADVATYNATVGAANEEAKTGQDVTVGERVERAADPGQLALSAGLGPVASVAYRGSRGVVTGVNNSIRAGKPTAGSFTPPERVKAAAPHMGDQSLDAARKANELVLDALSKSGLSPQDLRRAYENYRYAGYSSVQEMLFELAEAANNGQAGHITQLAVALGSVGGDAQGMAREAFRVRKADAARRIRNDLRKATGFSGETFYDVEQELARRARTDPSESYAAFHAEVVPDQIFRAEIAPILDNSPSAREALAEAEVYAADLGELEVARQLAAYRSAVERGAQGETLPTKALDYVHRMLGDRVQGIKRSSGRQELARGPADAQARLRDVLDRETSYATPRRQSAELKNSQNALNFGRKAFKQGTDLESLEREFARQIDEYGEEGGSELIRSSLLQGWIRGAEDEIATASNPATVIRRLYGSERQRDKLLAMLPNAPASAGAGVKGDATKRHRALVGGTRESGVEVPGRIDRERTMLNSEGRIVAGSQTAQRTEAIAAQGGTQDKVNAILDLFENANEARRKLIRAVVNRVTRPAIYDPKVNKALGEILFETDETKLDQIIRELEGAAATKAAKQNGGPPTAGGGGPPLDLLPSALWRKAYDNGGAGLPSHMRNDEAGFSSLEGMAAVAGASGGYVAGSQFGETESAQQTGALAGLIAGLLGGPTVIRVGRGAGNVLSGAIARPGPMRNRPGRVDGVDDVSAPDLRGLGPSDISDTGQGPLYANMVQRPSGVDRDALATFRRAITSTAGSDEKRQLAVILEKDRRGVASSQEKMDLNALMQGPEGISRQSLQMISRAYQAEAREAVEGMISQKRAAMSAKTSEELGRERRARAQGYDLNEDARLFVATEGKPKPALGNAIGLTDHPRLRRAVLTFPDQVDAQVAASVRSEANQGSPQLTGVAARGKRATVDASQIPPQKLGDTIADLFDGGHSLVEVRQPEGVAFVVAKDASVLRDPSKAKFNPNRQNRRDIYAGLGTGGAAAAGLWTLEKQKRLDELEAMEAAGQ